MKQLLKQYAIADINIIFLTLCCKFHLKEAFIQQLCGDF